MPDVIAVCCRNIQTSEAQWLLPFRIYAVQPLTGPDPRSVTETHLHSFNQLFSPVKTHAYLTYCKQGVVVFKHNSIIEIHQLFFYRGSMTVLSCFILTQVLWSGPPVEVPIISSLSIYFSLSLGMMFLLVCQNGSPEFWRTECIRSLCLITDRGWKQTHASKQLLIA